MKTSIEKEQVNYQTETQMSGKHCSVRKTLIFKLSTAPGEWKRGRHWNIFDSCKTINCRTTNSRVIYGWKSVTEIGFMEVTVSNLK